MPSSCSFWDLHVAIQDAMGWLDYHLHASRVQDPNTGEVVEIGIPYEELFEDSVQALPGWETPVLSYLNDPGQCADYEYDFGDSWNHQIILKEIVPREKGVRYPLCVGGDPGTDWCLTLLRSICRSGTRTFATCFTVNPGDVGFGEVERTLETGKERRLALTQTGRKGLIGHVVEELGWWACFQRRDDEECLGRDAFEVEDDFRFPAVKTIVRTGPKIGRNDPCHAFHVKPATQIAAKLPPEPGDDCQSRLVRCQL